MADAHARHGEHQRVGVDGGGREGVQHQEADGGHQEEEEHLPPPEAEQAEEHPRAGGGHMANSDAGEPWIESVSIQGSKRVPEQKKSHKPNLFGGGGGR